MKTIKKLKVEMYLDVEEDFVDEIKKIDAETRRNLGRVQTLEILSAVEFTFTNQEKNLLLSKMKEDVKKAPSVIPF